MAGKENREIKNSVFVDLFYEDESAEANEIALFNAIHDEPLPEGTKIRRFRVDNTIYMNFQNDISFDAGGKVIVFGEHQSTINENMPLRSLLYIGRAYERLVPPRSRYKKKIVPLPTPEFYTFYNGKEKWEKEKKLRLSDAYIVKDGEPVSYTHLDVYKRQGSVWTACRIYHTFKDRYSRRRSIGCFRIFRSFDIGSVSSDRYRRTSFRNCTGKNGGIVYRNRRKETGAVR